MRAAVLEGPRTVRVDEVAVPALGANEVRIRMSGSGVCGSNLPVWEGRPWFAYPFAPGAPGHEGWGYTDALGTAVTDLLPGMPVAFLSQHAFAEFDITPASDVVVLPQQLAGRPFPGEALACAVNVMRRAKVQPGEPLAIVGIGFLGAALVALAADAGANVTAITRRPSACRIAEELGAAATVVINDPWQAIAAAREVNGGDDYSAVFEVTGLQEPLDIASHLTRTRGRLVIAGYHQDGRRQIDMQLWNWRGLDVINAHERDNQVYVDGLREAVRLAADGTLPLDRLITHVFPLDELNDAFEHLANRPDGFLKAAVVASA